MNVYPVIMAGGSGTRFWPASRRDNPKQLLPLIDGKSMFRVTVDRLSKLFDPDRIRVVTPPDLRDKLQGEAQELSRDAFVDEPAPRDTAPCTGLAARHILRDDSDGAMLMLPCDHVISDESDYLRTVSTAIQVLQEFPDRLICFGITPDRPDTGYGYLEIDERIDQPNGIPVHQVRTFTEKPDREKAEEYVSSGNYLWNSGMFLWKAEEILKRLETHAPDIYSGLQTFEKNCANTDDPIEARSHFEAIPARSIDYAVMEKADDVIAIESDFGWSDVGTWDTLPELMSSDRNGNTINGKAFTQNANDCVIYNSEDRHLVACLDVDQLAVVHTDDATLICRLSSAQEVKDLVRKLEENDLQRYL